LRYFWLLQSFDSNSNKQTQKRSIAEERVGILSDLNIYGEVCKHQKWILSSHAAWLFAHFAVFV